MQIKVRPIRMWLLASFNVDLSCFKKVLILSMFSVSTYLNKIRNFQATLPKHYTPYILYVVCMSKSPKSIMINLIMRCKVPNELTLYLF